jgi:anti-sigma B factor antagonist
VFSIEVTSPGVIALSGSFDASQADKAREVFGALNDSAVVDFTRLDYISSAGLGVLLGAQQRLNSRGKGLTIVHMNGMIRDVFRIARFDQIFEIE